jgi:hypothetical protein
MKKMRRVQLFFSALMGIAILGACNSDDPEDNIPGSGFERGAMLEAVANDLIVPNFNGLNQSTQALAEASSNFTQSTNEANLEALRNAWVAAVTDHQHCSAFGFGPGELLLGPYATVLGVFPVDESAIEANIINPNFNLPNSFDSDIRGFYTIEYLIYRKDLTDQEILTSFDENRKNYLLLIVDELQNQIGNIVDEWEGSYLQEFTSNSGTSAGSPISLFYNAWVKDYENLKNFKVELPAGLTAGQEVPDGTLVEAYYSGISVDLIEEHWKSSRNIYLGLSRNGDESIGWEDYLESVVGGPALVESTKDAISDIDAAVANLPEGKLSENIQAQEVVTLRNELQANTANFKSSISSLTGLTITFNSGDGD